MFSKMGGIVEERIAFINQIDCLRERLTAAEGLFINAFF
jgi:hypothetical protein